MLPSYQFHPLKWLTGFTSRGVGRVVIKLWYVLMAHGAYHARGEGICVHVRPSEVSSEASQVQTSEVPTLHSVTDMTK